MGGTDFNILGPHVVVPISSDETSIPVTTHKKVDTLSVADQEALATMMLAGYPLLPPPSSVDYSGEMSLAGLSQKSEQQLQEIAKNMLKSWSAAIARDSEVVREYLTSDAYRQWQSLHSAPGQGGVEKTIPSVLPTSEFIHWAQHREAVSNEDPILSNVGAYMQRVNSGDLAAIASLPFGMVNFTAPGALFNNDSPYFRDLVISTNLPFQPGPRADLGLVGAIFSAGALNYAEAANTAQAISGKKEHNHKNLALNYGNRIVSLITDPNFDSFLGAMFANKGSRQQIDERIAVFKMVLAATGLMAIYSSEAKYISKGDLEGMINGTTLPRSTTEASLVAIFHTVRDSGRVSTSVYQQMVSGLGDYANKNPNFSSFFKVDDAFAAIADRVAATKNANATLPTSTPI